MVREGEFRLDIEGDETHVYKIIEEFDTSGVDLQNEFLSQISMNKTNYL